MFRFASVLILAAFAAALVRADQGRWSYWMSAGQSALILGSEDSRRWLGIAAQYARPDPQLKIRGMRPHLVYEAYEFRTTSRGRFEFGPDTAYMVGLLGLCRWETLATGSRAFLEAGWGLQYASRVTLDLPSLLNSTPTIGIGVIIPSGRSQMFAGLRLMHISNAGTKGNNPGQNIVSFMLGWQP